MKKPAIFLDRDGVLNKAIPKNDLKKTRPPYKLSELKIYKDLEVINKFKKKYLIFIVTNQPDIKKGLQSKKFNNYINMQIKKIIKVNGIYTCECLEIDKGCYCYKPKPGLIKKILSKYDVSLNESYLIGDTWRDIKLANYFKIKSIHLMRSNVDYSLGMNTNYRIKTLKSLENIIYV